METLNTNCLNCKTLLELFIPYQALKIIEIKGSAVVKFKCNSCSEQFMIQIGFSSPKVDSEISNSKFQSANYDQEKEPRIFHPLKPRPQIRKIKEISEYSTIADFHSISSRIL
jgi:hypothetical protein